MCVEHLNEATGDNKKLEHNLSNHRRYNATFLCPTIHVVVFGPQREAVGTDPPLSPRCIINLLAMANAAGPTMIDLDTAEAFDVSEHLQYPVLHGQLADVHHGHLCFPIQYEDGHLKRFDLNHFITLPQLGVTTAPDRPYGWHE